MQSLKALFARFDLAHVLLVLAFVATVAVPDAVNLENALGLGSAVAVTLKIGTYLSGLLMLLKQFSPAPTAADTIQGQASKLRSLGLLTMVGVLVMALAGCGAGQLFGPGSTVPSDLQAEESCVFDKLQGGVTDPVAVGVACGIPEGKLFTDLLAYALDALGIKIPLLGRQSVGSYVTAKRAAGQ